MSLETYILKRCTSINICCAISISLIIQTYVDARELATPDPIPAKIATSDIAVQLQLINKISPDIFPTGKVRLNYLTHANDGTTRLFVDDMFGRIHLIKDGQLQPEAFINIEDLSQPDFYGDGGETGLISIAFHPDFAKENTPGYGKVYTVSTGLASNAFNNPEVPVFTTGESEIALYNVLQEWTIDSENKDRIDPLSRRELMRFVQPSRIHNVGLIAFNPTAEPDDPDYGKLYIPVGDGGHPLTVDMHETEPYKQAQKTSSVFGKILRIDPIRDNERPYTIPDDNPFVEDPAYQPDVWALGFRNPQRISWDTKTGKMFITDIGQNNIEEVNLGIAGGNYGWSFYEGIFLIDPHERGKIYQHHEDDQSDKFIDPVAMFDHDEGNAITGGYVYRGSKIPSLYGQYLFADILSGRLFHIDADTAALGKQSTIKELRIYHYGVEAKNIGMGSHRVDPRFGSDAHGNIFIMLKHNGDIYRIEQLTTLRTNNYYWYLFKDKLNTGSNINFDVDRFENDGIISIHLATGRNHQNKSKIHYSFVGVDIMPVQETDLSCQDCLLGVEIEYSLNGNMALLLNQIGIKPGHEYRVQLESTTKFKKIFFPLSTFSQPSWIKNDQPLLNYEIRGMKLQLIADKPVISNILISSIRLTTRH